MSNWLYKGNALRKEPSEYYGFVYRITVEDSEDLPAEMRGKIYIGKKQFRYNRKKRLSKKRRKETGKRVERVLVDSKWLGYYGSNKLLNEDVKKYGEKYFRREILHLCNSKPQLSYYEVVEQISHRVLMVNSYNGWISCRIFKNRFAIEKEEE